MILSKRFQFIYLPTPKCASRSMAAVLKRHYQAEEAGGHHANRIPEHWLPYYFIFGVVRNPFARHVSTYRYIQRTPAHRYHHAVRDLGFPEFVTFYSVATTGSTFVDDWTQAEYLYGPQLQRRSRRDIHLLRFESLQEDFARLPFSGTELIDLPQLNASAPYQWQDYYSDPTVQAQVVQWAYPDFTLFDYSQEVV